MRSRRGPLLSHRRFSPSLLAAVGYLVVALAILAPSIRPGHTLVPADTLTNYSPYRELAGGFRAQNPIVADAATQFFPWFRFLNEGLRRGRVLQWNSYVVAGVPVTPNGYVSAYYPMFWLGRWLSTYDAYNTFVLVHLVLGALGIFALSRTVGARPLSSWTVGLMGFAVGSWLHWSLHLTHIVAMVGLPWAMAAVHRLAQRPTIGRAAALSVVLSLWWLGGNPQYLYYGGLATECYLVAHLVWEGVSPRKTSEPDPAAQSARQRVARGAVAVVGAGLVAGLIAAPVLLPTLVNPTTILRQNEPSSSVTQTHLPLRHAIRALVPDATGNPADGFIYASTEEFEMSSPFFGLSAVLLVAAAVASVRRWERSASASGAGREIVILALGAAVVVVISFTGPPHAWLHAILPGYDRFRGSDRWIAVLPAFALPLAALGLDAVIDGVRRARRGVSWATGVAGLIICAWLGRELLVRTAPHGYLVRRALFAGVLLVGIGAALRVCARRPGLLALAFLVVAGLEVAWSAPRWYPDVEKRHAYPSIQALEVARARQGRLVRVAGGSERRAEQALSENLPPDIPMAYGVADVSGLTPLFPQDYDRYLRLVDDYDDAALQLNAAPPLSRGDLLTSPLLRVLDVRTAVGEGARVLAGPESLGSALLVPEAQPSSSAQTWRALAAPWDPTALARVEGLSRPIVGGRGEVRLLGVAGHDAQTWAVEAPRGGFLRVSGRYERGWSAWVDGRRAPVLRADGIFRGVVVNQGRHVVTFTYRNPMEATGRALAVTGLALIGLLLTSPALRRARPRPCPGDGGALAAAREP